MIGNQHRPRQSRGCTARRRICTLLRSHLLSASKGSEGYAHIIFAHLIDIPENSCRAVHATHMACTATTHLSTRAILAIKPSYDTVPKLDISNIRAQLQFLVGKGGDD